MIKINSIRLIIKHFACYIHKWWSDSEEFMAIWFWIAYSMLIGTIALSEWLTDWLIRWLTDSVTDWFGDWLIRWLTDSVTDWFGDWLIRWLTDSVTDWLIRSLADWFGGWPADSLTHSMIVQIVRVIQKMGEGIGHLFRTIFLSIQTKQISTNINKYQQILINSWTIMNSIVSNSKSIFGQLNCYFHWCFEIIQWTTDDGAEFEGYVRYVKNVRSIRYLRYVRYVKYVIHVS
jgi:hypothetical protein